MPKYDDEEIICGFCKFIGKPIIERKKMDIGLGMSPGHFLEELALLRQ
jgi:hypothetical protein